MRRFLTILKKKTAIILYLSIIGFNIGCDNFKSDSDSEIDDLFLTPDSVVLAEEEPKTLTASDIILKKEIQFEDYNLDDVYPHKDTTRVFQWEKIQEKIAHIENEVNSEGESHKIGIFSNYRNKNGEAPTVSDFVRNEYRRVSDQYGVERYQSVPLYSFEGDTILERYGRDGWIAHILGNDTTDMIRVRGVSFEGEYLIPNRYLIPWGDSIKFDKVVAVDVTNQNISTLEKRENEWYILSMNPATTGVHKPPYALETPVGIFAIQEQKEKMFYTKDGSSEIAGYAPYASRFTNGAYIHGVPTQNPRHSIIEWSNTLGTTPRSHMCVRNASSHSKFVYDWVTVKEAVVVVID
ncbi:MAG: L,D-transpeptidase [Fermentimonas sp.]|nr:L,D-transpeptidase [Fermentimonas sp.]